MLLAIDVGNSDTKLGFFAHGADGTLSFLRETWRVTTVRRRSADEFGVLFTGLFRRARVPVEDVGAIVVSSVVPPGDRALREACVRYFGCEPSFFTAAEQRLIEIRTERPRELGSDFAAAAIAARALHGSPVVVVGFGTATTFGAVDIDKE